MRVGILFGLGSLLTAAEEVGLRTWPTRLRISAEEVSVTGGEAMGLAGLGYDALAPLPSLPGLWWGLGGYGAAWGDRGGLFVVGPSLGWRQHLAGPLGFEVGGFAGGGGGANAGQGDGLMLRSHAQLGFDLGFGELAAGWAYTTFPGGEIEGHSWTVAWHQADVVTLVGEPVGGPAYVDRRRWSVAPQMLAYWPEGDLGRSGRPLAERIDLVGIGIARGLTQYVSLPLRLAAAYDGEAAGYMEVLGGLSMTSGGVIAVEAALLAGLGGGGDLDTGGGGLLRGEAGLSAALSTELRLSLRGGWTWAVEGDFDAATAVAELIWTTTEWYQFEGDQGTLAEGAVRQDPWRLGLGLTRYAVDGGRDDIALVDVVVEKPLVSWLALTGRARSALDGEAGGYSEGLFGARLEWPVHRDHVLGLGGEVGAGGGGGLSTGGGAIGAVLGQYRWQFSRTWGVSFSAGRLRASDGDFTTDLATVALVWTAVRGLAE